MRSSYERIMQIEMLSLGAALLFGLLALILTSVVLLMVSIYLIAISLACDALQHMYARQQIHFVKQLTRAILFLILPTVLLLLL